MNFFYENIDKESLVGWLNGGDPNDILIEIIRGEKDIRELRRDIGSWAGMDIGY